MFKKKNKKLKKKELFELIENYEEENKILLNMIEELKISSVVEPKIVYKEKIIYQEQQKLNKKEQRHQNKINYLKKRFKITNNIIYQDELDRY